MTQDIDVGKLAEQINDKADRDLSNLSESGKEVIMILGMPDYSNETVVDWNTEVTRDYPVFVHVVPSGTAMGTKIYLTVGSTDLEIYNEGGGSGSYGTAQFFIAPNIPYKAHGGYTNSGKIYEYPLKGAM